MTARARLTALGIAASLAVCGSLALAAGASADFHFMKIREISGESAAGNDAYIELQMYVSGQNQVAGHDISIWDFDAFQVGSPDGSIEHITLTGPNPPNAQNQQTILIGDSAVPNADFTVDLTPYLDQTPDPDDIADAGAVCFEAQPVDCVSWGGAAFTGAGNLPDDATPFGEPLPATFAIQRDISAGCATLLEATDDTNNNAADFAPLVPRDPTPNSATPIEEPCGGPGAGNDQNVFCGGKRATKVGGNGRNVLRGTPGRDVIAGLGGNDTIRGLGGNDILCGGKGRDKLIGGKGRDRLLGGPGRDTCKGGPKKDIARKCEIKRTI